MNDDLLGYDDIASVKFIQNHIPQELKEICSEDDIIYIVDLIYEFYDSRGFVGDDEDEDFEFDEDELLEFVIKNALRDKVGKFTKEQIQFIVQGELAYCDSIGIFEN